MYFHSPERNARFLTALGSSDIFKSEIMETGKLLFLGKRVQLHNSEQKICTSSNVGEVALKLLT